mgnify:CR=1 FL=1
MTSFWSWYIILLTGGTLVALTWLIFATRKGQRKDTTEETLGHAFDGIEEYDNPLPKWWFWLFVGTLVFSVGYLILYPGLGNWKGILPGYSYLDNDKQTEFSNGQPGWTGVHEWEKEMAKADARFGPIFAKFAAMPVEEVAKDPQALKMGGRLFASNCAVCHGSDAKGAFGFPNLADSTWRWGGSWRLCASAACSSWPAATWCTTWRRCAWERASTPPIPGPAGSTRAWPTWSRAGSWTRSRALPSGARAWPRAPWVASQCPEVSMRPPSPPSAPPSARKVP